LMNLGRIHPDVAEQFENWHFVISKSYAFSLKPIDQLVNKTIN
jgi:hypothetical protein